MSGWSGILYLAWRDIRFYKARSLILFAAFTVMVFLPLTTWQVLRVLEQRLGERADATPMILGAKGSRIDLALHTLYFRTPVPEFIRYADYEELAGQELAEAIPLYQRFTARKLPVVSTTQRYLAFRGLRIERGEAWDRMGDCLLGAGAARRLGLGPGERLMSDPENLFDIAGVYPLNMRITGVLTPSHGPDDDAVFCSLETGWVIEGLGHGHDEVENEEALSPNQQAKIFKYNEITEANRFRFHFHVKQAERPLSAVIALPPDARSTTLLAGRYLEHPRQLIRGRRTIDEVLAMVFAAKRWFDGIIGLVFLAITSLIILVVMLSLRLREGEIRTLFKLGCEKRRIAGLHALGIGSLFLAGALCGLGACALVVQAAPSLMARLL